MSEPSSSMTKRLVLFGLAVLFAAWAVTEVVRLLASVWWQAIIVLVIVAVIVVGFTLWKTRRQKW